MKKCVLTTAILLALSVSPAFAAEIKFLKLEAGRTEKNQVASPIYEEGVAPITVEPLVSRLAPDHKLVHPLRNGKPQFRLSPAIDLGKQLSAAIGAEGTAMGLRMAAPGAAGWTVSGTLDDVYLDTRFLAVGPTFFYAYLKVTLTVRQGAGEPRTVAYRLHNMYARVVSFGMGSEVAEVLANFWIDSSQEIVARLNRDFFQAPARPSIKSRAAALSASSLDDREAELRMIGLSGSRDALPVLLTLLAKEKDEGNRVYVLDALASLGAAEAIQPLAQRYAEEDEDCRFFILKAWDYIGGEEAQRQIAQNGAKEKDDACRALAARLKVKRKASEAGTPGTGEGR